MPGSKRRSFAHIMPHLPKPAPGRGYIIPFFGIGGDTAHLTRAGQRITRIGDANPHFAHLYRCLRDYPLETNGRILRMAATFPLGVGMLYEQRDLFMSWRTHYNHIWPQVGRHAEPEAAALFLCVWRAGFNGVIRANSKGEINTPPGMTDKTGPKRSLVDLEALRTFSAWLGTLPPVEPLDYAELIRGCPDPGDVGYYDPPYYLTYDGYFGKRFDTERLVRFLQTEDPHAWGMSNTAHERWRTDFPALQHHRVYRAGTISSDGGDRGRVPEALIVRLLTPLG